MTRADKKKKSEWSKYVKSLERGLRDELDQIARLKRKVKNYYGPEIRAAIKRYSSFK